MFGATTNKPGMKDGRLRCVPLAPADPYSHYAVGMMSIVANQPNRAMEAAQRSLDLSPSFALGYLELGLARVFAGLAAQAVEPAPTGTRLSPHDPQAFIWLQFLAFAHFLSGACEEALRKGLDHLDAVRTTFQAITDRFAGFQAEWLNSHVDFPLLQRLARPVSVGAVRYPGLKIHEPRIIRLFEVLLHGGPQIGGWTTRQIHRAVLTSFDLSEKAYGLNQLRYDLRKLKGHGLIERDGSRYAYRLTPKGVQVALLFLFRPLANSRFHHRPDPQHRPDSRLEAAYHRADAAIQRVIDLLAAA